MLPQRVLNEFIEDQVFLQLYDSAPRPPFPPLSHQQVVSVSQSSFVSPVQLTDWLGGGGGEGGGEEPKSGSLYIIQYSLCIITWEEVKIQKKIQNSAAKVIHHGDGPQRLFKNECCMNVSIVQKEK